MPATGKHAPWRLWILIVGFVLQLIFLLASIGVGAAAVVIYSNALDNDQRLPQLNTSIVIVTFVLYSIPVLLTVAEIVQIGRLSLSPSFYTLSNAVKLLMSIGAIVIAIIGGGRSLANVIVDALVILLFCIPMVYGAIIWHRYGSRTNLGADNNQLKEKFGRTYTGAELPEAHV